MEHAAKQVEDVRRRTLRYKALLIHERAISKKWFHSSTSNTR